MRWLAELLGAIPRKAVGFLVEGVAALAEVLRALGDALQLEGGDLGAVLGALEVAHFRLQLVHGAVEALRLLVQPVDQAPQHRLALVGELRAFDGDAGDDDEDGLRERVLRLRGVPNFARVGLVSVRPAAEAVEALADRGGWRCCRRRRSPCRRRRVRGRGEARGGRRRRGSR